MEITIYSILVLSLLFFLAGLVDSVAGGGGLVTVPTLLAFGVPPHATLGTSKFATTMGMVSSLWTFAHSRLIVTSIAPVGFIAALIGAVCGSNLTMVINSDMLGKILIFLLPVGMGISLLSSRFSRYTEELPPRFLRTKTFAICLVIGMYSGFFGPGAGSFFILAQNIILRMGLVKASATTKVFTLASNCGALATFAMGGVILWSLGIPLAAASILGNIAGARLAIRSGSRIIRIFLYITLSMLTLTLIHRFFLS
ncbi:MAG: TSUP family transporter [Mailhella sp.]|nr:TSUP family transporter [Mailhella sp.]